MKIVVDNCAFLPCDQVDECVMVGGCITKRFGKMQGKSQDVLKKGAAALVGMKPGRTNRDPSQIKRTRKPLR